MNMTQALPKNIVVNPTVKPIPLNPTTVKVPSGSTGSFPTGHDLAQSEQLHGGIFS